MIPSDETVYDLSDTVYQRGVVIDSQQASGGFGGAGSISKGSGD